MPHITEYLLPYRGLCRLPEYCIAFRSMHCPTERALTQCRILYRAEGFHVHALPGTEPNRFARKTGEAQMFKHVTRSLHAPLPFLLSLRVNFGMSR